ncbi:hypothetical protein BUALT_Bualt05G0157500 [Buddleja alternifolia]|uniref:Uncharacterized protein n=1 Tax=Buddleja alternifolia TaxID=168488 RepID=A0AAV6XSW5_9LAMI|nr:hypothetical protein BUALT_Bualt05G0157500 [Buddleja alternifolia]
MCGGENGSPIAAEDIFIDGQIKTVFPLFNGQDYSVYSVEDLHENLPTRPPVKRVFVETVEDKKIPVMSSTPENDDISGPYCDLSTRKVVEASPEVCKKSNSTGFSKIWRLRDLVGRSNSDGRDAFVYLNGGPAPPSTVEKAAAKGEEKKEAAATVKKSGNKGKMASSSAHEVYLRSKAKEEERPRRSTYLPYRPELMGFFTNVNGGLTKNVHPY